MHYSGLADRRKGRVSLRRVPLNVWHFHEKLREGHDIELSYTWVYQALVGAGLGQGDKLTTTDSL